MLCVDDEPAVLDSLRRQLYAQFVIVGSGPGPRRWRCWARTLVLGAHVGHADARDERRDGADEARAVQPDTVRVLLTGQADMEDAVAAVNDGNIFRFLINRAHGLSW